MVIAPPPVAVASLKEPAVTERSWALQTITS